MAVYDYDAFGQSVRVTEPEANLNPVRFSSKYTDEETGLVYYGYRYYAPEQGRWLSRDPIGEKGGINLNAVANNNLVDRVDALGLELEKVTGFFKLDDLNIQKMEYSFEFTAACGRGGSVEVSGPNKREFNRVGAEGRDIPDSSGFGLSFELGPLSAGGGVQWTMGGEVNMLVRSGGSMDENCQMVEFRVSIKPSSTVQGELGFVYKVSPSQELMPDFQPTRIQTRSFIVCCNCNKISIEPVATEIYE